MSNAADTPMMRQYLEIKAQAPDALLLYRMGDFYECFFEDAREAAELLGLTLTSRNKNDPDPIPMAGVPYHALEGYLSQLIEAGRKVAIAEQSSSGLDGEGKKLLDRRLVRVVTAGMPWDPAALDAREGCYLAGLSGAEGGPVGLAFLDISTGDLRLTEVASLEAAAAELQRMEAREVVLHPALSAVGALQPGLQGRSLHKAEASLFDERAARRGLTRQLEVADLDGFGAEALGPALGAAWAALSYARDTARLQVGHLRRLVVYKADGEMVLDEATRRNLELLRPLRGTGRRGTLIGLLDRSQCPMGARLLRDWLSRPLVELEAIHERQEAVAALLDPPLRSGIRDALRRVADIERLTGKAVQSTANARDLVALAASIEALPGVVVPLAGLPAMAGHLPADLCADVARTVTAWLEDEPPASLTDGGLIRPGVHPELDQLRDTGVEGRGAIAAIEERERRRTGISSLKVKHNRISGFFLEVTQANQDKVPKDWHLKQQLSGAFRFITPELKEYEERVLGADDKRKALEYELFCELRGRVAAECDRLFTLARAVAWIDVIAALAEVAVSQRFVRPLVDDSGVIEITDGRHPVVEASLTGERFVPSSLRLDPERRLIILTGPNMAGKSTVMRQVALITLLAQMGSFVPAAAARVGLCDRVFVRVGASDDLASGRSTFMVEMSETAWILNQATHRSLILLDEIGRGTSTYDGLAIAWSVAEAVADKLRARAVFATHYHELIGLADERRSVVNRHVAVSEWGDKIVFLRALKEGGASRSYGIQCARLAGMPVGVVDRARELLVELERRPKHGPPTRQLSLFAPAPPPPPPPDPVADALRAAVVALRPDELSPREALQALYTLKALAEGS